MTRSLLVTFAVPAFLVLAILGVVLAQDGTYDSTAPQPQASTMSGTLVSSTGSTLVIRTDTGVETTFVLDADSILPASMVPGDRVTIEYHIRQEGGYHASHVTMNSAGTTAPGTMSASVSAVDQGPGTTSDHDEMLPRTASPVPLVAMLSVLSITTAAGLRLLASRQRPRF